METMLHTKERQVSVAMATYNGARFIGAQLASIAAQSVLPCELILGDDGSTDDTLSIVAEFARTAPFPVHVTRNAQRLGYAGNFMQTAARCSAPLIAFCDQDDLWRVDKIAKIQTSFAHGADILMVYHNAMLINASGVPIRPSFDAPPSPSIAPALSLQPWTFSYGYSQVFRRVLLGAAPFWSGLRDTFDPDRDMGHDVFFFALAATLGKVAYVHDCLVDYRQHDAQAFGALTVAPPGILRRWLYRLEDRRHIYAHLARVADSFASVISRWRASADLEPWLSVNAASAAQAWELLATLYSQREIVCAAASPLDRWEAMRKLARQGAYGEGFWTFGSKAQLKDGVLGLLLAPLVGRYGRTASAGDPIVRRGQPVKDAAP